MALQYDELKEIANKYSDVTTFRKEDLAAYKRIKKLGLNELLSHLKKESPKKIHDHELIKRAKKYKTVAELVKNDNSAYVMLRTRGLIDTVFPERRRKITFVELEKRVKNRHGDKYKLIKSSYTIYTEPVAFECKKHGIVTTIAKNLAERSMCPKCAKENSANKHNAKFKETALERARGVHGDKYDYSKTIVGKSLDAVSIICPVHGEFRQVMKDHLQGYGCPKCAKNLSKAEEEIASFLKGLGEKVIQSDRTIIKPFELDIVLPEHKIAIEFNGLRWHSEEFGKDKWYHRKKTDACTEVGYRLIHIFEDSWMENKEKILSFLAHAVGKSDKKRVFARKCNIRPISSKVGREFLEKHHIQGAGPASFYYGTYHGDELVAVASFTTGRKNTKNKGMYELSRYATSCNVIGGLGKMAKHIKREFGRTIYTFCDLSYFDGRSYEAAGFKRVGEIEPDYQYVVDNGSRREHKFLWRKEAIKRKLGIEGGTESEMMEEAGIYRIWDCGKVRYEM